jgi:hypothetical protein
VRIGLLSVMYLPHASMTYTLQWLGLRPSQLDKLDLPQQAYAVQTTADEKRLVNIFTTLKYYTVHGQRTSECDVTLPTVERLHQS